MGYRARTVLVLVVALQLIAETALTPYWPLLFRELFGVDELAATGTYLTACRVAGLVAMPLWGFAALRWPVARLLVVGLLASAVFDLGLALAPTLTSFTVLSAAVVASGSCLVLAYPALVAVVEGDGRQRLHAVLIFSAVFHASAVVATLLGAGVVALPQPRVGLAAFAVVDLALALLVLATVPVRPPAAMKSSAREGGSARDVERRRDALRIGILVATVILVDSGLAVPRPFFVELLVRDGISVAAASVLFFLPAAAALLSLTVAGWAVRRLAHRLVPMAAALSAAGLLLQAVAAVTTADLTLLCIGRVVLGVGLGLLLVALDLAVFAAVGTAGPGFGVVESGRSAALLAAPLVATAAADTWLGLPLVAGAVLLVLGGALGSRRLAPSPVPSPDPEVPLVRDHVRSLPR